MKGINTVITDSTPRTVTVSFWSKLKNCCCCVKKNIDHTPHLLDEDSVDTSYDRSTFNHPYQDVIDKPTIVGNNYWSDND